MKSHVDVPIEKIEEFCRRNHIRRMAFFGSVLREDFRPDSDVDVLVEFEPGFPVGLVRFAGIERELSDLLGRRADLNTQGFISPDYLDEILRESEIRYVASR